MVTDVVKSELNNRCLVFQHNDIMTCIIFEAIQNVDPEDKCQTDKSVIFTIKINKTCEQFVTE